MPVLPKICKAQFWTSPVHTAGNKVAESRFMKKLLRKFFMVAPSQSASQHPKVYPSITKCILIPKKGTNFRQSVINIVPADV